MAETLAGDFMRIKLPHSKETYTFCSCSGKELATNAEAAGQVYKCFHGVKTWSQSEVAKGCPVSQAARS